MPFDPFGIIKNLQKAASTGNPPSSATPAAAQPAGLDIAKMAQDEADRADGARQAAVLKKKKKAAGMGQNMIDTAQQQGGTPQ